MLMSNVVQRPAIFLFTTELLGVIGPKKRLFSSALSLGLRNLRNDQRGTIAVMTRPCATALAGFAALAIDAASWQVTQPSTQGPAGAAGYSAGDASAHSHRHRPLPL